MVTHEILFLYTPRPAKTLFLRPAGSRICTNRCFKGKTGGWTKWPSTGQTPGFQIGEKKRSQCRIAGSPSILMAGQKICLFTLYVPYLKKTE